MLLLLYVVFIVLLIICITWAFHEEDEIAWVFAIIISGFLALNSYNLVETYVATNSSITTVAGSTYTSTYTNIPSTVITSEPTLMYFFLAITGICLIMSVIQVWRNIQKRRELI